MSEFEILTIQQNNREFILSLAVAIISFLSALLVYFDYRHRKKKERAEKSISIAEKFANNIIDPISIIFAFFKKEIALLMAYSDSPNILTRFLMRSLLLFSNAS